MPIFRLKCECGKEIRFMSHKKTTPPNCQNCGKKMFFVMTPPSIRAMNTADEYRKKSVLDGTNSLVDDRAKDFFKKHELPRLIAEEGIESARAKGHVDEDGNPK